MTLKAKALVRMTAAIMITTTMIWMFTMTGMAPQAHAGTALSDDEKREIVYEMYAGYKKKFPAVSDISPKKAMALMKTGKVVFVDTRSPEEMAVSMLPGAVSKAAFLAHQAAYHDYLVIGYCTISYRSGKFAEEMAAKGCENEQPDRGLAGMGSGRRESLRYRRRVPRIHDVGFMCMGKNGIIRRRAMPASCSAPLNDFSEHPQKKRRYTLFQAMSRRCLMKIAWVSPHDLIVVDISR